MAEIALTEGRARARLQDMVAHTCTPVLSVEEVDELLTMAKVPDEYGVEPSTSTWTPTWELNHAAAHGWRLKAGKAASETSFSADGQSVKSQELIDNCLRMMQHYEARIVERSGGAIEEDWEVVGNL